ncbi:hypothetical protein [Aureimonas sp. AU4]|uniref:hypothetical protein n=1 Tax=Aureimonas sp. AU4 TaxID=1638163 RepID=UPI00078514E7|nr:hypothetical protein [Aureimonas sp. AU4]
MWNELPALSDVAAASLAVGVLFLARFALALRRLRADSGLRGGGMRHAWGVRFAGSFGTEHEPERRHAARQLGIGLVFLSIAVALYGWLVSVSVLRPILAEGGLVALGRRIVT